MLRILFYLCVFTLSLGQFSSLGKDGGMAFYAFDGLVFIFVAAGLIHLLISRKKFEIPAASVPFLLFSIWAAFSGLVNFGQYSTEDILIAVFYLLRWIIYLLLGLVVFNLVKEKILIRENIEAALTYSSLFLIAAGILQLIFIPDFEAANLTTLGWDPHKNRLASTFLDPNFLGAYLNISIFLLSSRLINKGLKIKEWLILLVLTAGVVLTFSRSAWLMLGAGVLVFAVLKRPLWLILACVLGFLAYFAVPRVQTRISGATDPADSAHFRLISWENAYKVYRDNKVFGVGFNAYRYVQKDYGFLTPDTETSHSGAGADSSILFVLATTGLIGGLLFVWGLLGLFIGSKSLFAVAFIASLILESVFINSIFYPQILFWIVTFGFISRVSRT